MKAEVRWEPLRERLDAATECAWELARSARLLAEESHRLTDENACLRRQGVRAAEERGNLPAVQAACGIM